MDWLKHETFCPNDFSSESKIQYFQRQKRKGEIFEDLRMSSSAGARSVLGNMTNLRLGPDTGLLRPGIKTHVTGGKKIQLNNEF